MSLKGRLARLERALANPPELDDPWRDLWDWFRDTAFAHLEQGGFPEALALARERVAGNEPHVFRADSEPAIRDGWDFRLWVMTQTLWVAVREYPEAYEYLDACMVREVEALAAG
jgi:hypothetical protein